MTPQKIFQFSENGETNSDLKNKQPSEKTFTISQEKMPINDPILSDQTKPEIEDKSKNEVLLSSLTNKIAIPEPGVQTPEAPTKPPKPIEAPEEVSTQEEKEIIEIERQRLERLKREWESPSQLPSEDNNNNVPSPNDEPNDKPTEKPDKKPNGEPTETPNGEPTETPNGQPKKEPHDEPKKQSPDEPKKEPHEEPGKKPNNDPNEERKTTQPKPKEPSKPKDQPPDKGNQKTPKKQDNNKGKTKKSKPSKPTKPTKPTKRDITTPNEKKPVLLPPPKRPDPNEENKPKIIPSPTPKRPGEQIQRPIPIRKQPLAEIVVPNQKGNDVDEPKTKTKLHPFHRSEPLYIRSKGRRKRATAVVNLTQGRGQIKINHKPALDYMQTNHILMTRLLKPLTLLRLNKKVTISILVKGGGLAGQSDAIKLAISRAVCEYASEYRSDLKKAGLLTRDSRIKERKKYGLKKARKAPQFSKR